MLNLLLREPETRVALQTEGNYVCAESGGNSTVIANRQAVGLWETFFVHHNKDFLEHDDEIRLSTYGGFYLGGSGGNLEAKCRFYPGPSERFTIIRHAGSGRVTSGDEVSFRTTSGHYLCADRSKDWRLTADRTECRSWEKFTISVL